MDGEAGMKEIIREQRSMKIRSIHLLEEQDDFLSSVKSRVNFSELCRRAVDRFVREVLNKEEGSEVVLSDYEKAKKALLKK